MIDLNELRRLTQAVVKGWGNCDQAWLDQSEDTPAAVVGHIDEDGNTYPVATIDCDQYCAGHQSLPLAKFYAAANPAAISELLDRLEAAEKERDALRAKIERMEKTWLSPEGYHILMQEREDILFQAEKMKQRAPCIDISTWPTNHTQPTQPAPNIPPMIEPNGMYDGSHHYASGWNDCRAAMLETQPEAKP